MREPAQGDKIDKSLTGESGVDRSVPDTSFIANIQIDVSQSDRTPSPEASFISNSGVTNVGSQGNTSRLNTGMLPGASRTTTLALDPRPYRRRERVYATIIVILSAVVFLLTLQLYFISRETRNTVSSAQIIIGGVETNRGQIERVADQFMREHTGLLVTVEPLGARAALSALAEGRISIAQTSRRLTARELDKLRALAGKDIQEIALPPAPVAIYVHRDNPINELTMAQLRAIYAGEMNNWKALGGPDLPIVLYGGNYLTDLRGVFQEKVMGGVPIKQPIIAFNDIDELHHQFSFAQGGIGFGDAMRPINDLRVIKLKLNDNIAGVGPLEVESGDRYPLFCDSYFYIASPPNESLKSFLGMFK